MKKVILLALFALLLAGLSYGQDRAVLEGAGVHSYSIDAHGNPIPMPRKGKMIWDNEAWKGWFSGVDTGYLNLDWGELPDQGNGLPDEVIDGFKFYYGTNNMDPAGEDITIYYYDSCTGHGNKGILEAGFTYTGLPNGFTHGTLPPGRGWILRHTVDLEGSGYEFLLGDKIGIGFVRDTTPTMGGTGFVMGSPSNKAGNGFTGTEDVYDTYYPSGGYQNSWWFFGGWPTNPWATFAHALWGASDPGTNTSYGGIGAPGNAASLYTTGSWSSGGTVEFLLRKNNNALPGWLLASMGVHWPPLYLANFDVSLFLQTPFAKRLPMKPDQFGDFDRLSVKVPPGVVGSRVYFQGAITAFGPIKPAEMSQVVYTN